MIVRQLLYSAVLVFLLVLFPGAARSGDSYEFLRNSLKSPAELQVLTKEGKEAASFCFNCHGDNGNSNIPEVPNLAEQNPRYILNQIDAFLSGTRKDAFMQGLMKLLTERERAGVALFFASQKVIPASSTPGPLATTGEQLFKTYCARCHHEDARGGERFPRLAGQQPEYLKINLNRYLTMSDVRYSPEMNNAVHQLGQANIPAITDYLSSLK